MLPIPPKKNRHKIEAKLFQLKVWLETLWYCGYSSHWMKKTAFQFSCIIHAWAQRLRISATPPETSECMPSNKKVFLVCTCKKKMHLCHPVFEEIVHGLLTDSFFENFAYLLPCLVNAVINFLSVLLVFFVLPETLPSKRYVCLLRTTRIRSEISYSSF